MRTLHIFFFFLRDIFTFTWLHCTSLTRHGGSYFSNLILIPDWLRWRWGIAVISDWLSCFFTSYPVFRLEIFLNFYSFLNISVLFSKPSLLWIISKSSVHCLISGSSVLDLAAYIVLHHQFNNQKETRIFCKLVPKTCRQFGIAAGLYTQRTISRYPDIWLSEHRLSLYRFVQARRAAGNWGTRNF